MNTPKLLTKAEFARKCGVSKEAVGKAARGLLLAAVTAGKIDTAHPVAVAYLEKHSKPKPGPGRGRPRKDAPGDPDKGAGPAGELYERAVQVVIETQEPRPEILSQALAVPLEKARQLIQSMERAGIVSGPRGAYGRLVLVGRPESAEGKMSPFNKNRDIEAHLDLTLRQILAEFGTAESFSRWLSARKTLEEIREKQTKNAENERRLIPRDMVRNHIFGSIEDSNLRLLTDAPRTIARRVYGLAKSKTPVEEAEALVRDLISAQLKTVKATAVRLLGDA